MTNPDELERLARAATEGPWSVDERLEPECVRGRYDDIVVMETERLSDAAFIAAANPATVLALLSANREMRERIESVAKYLCRLEGALLADDLDMKLNFPGEPSPTAMAETILPGFDSIEYDLARSALTTQRGDGE